MNITFQKSVVCFMQKFQFSEISCLVKLQENTPQSTLFDCFRQEEMFSFHLSSRSSVLCSCGKFCLSINLFQNCAVNFSRKVGGIVNINADVNNTYHDRQPVFFGQNVYWCNKILIALQWIFSNVFLVR